MTLIKEFRAQSFCKGLEKEYMIRINPAVNNINRKKVCGVLKRFSCEKTSSNISNPYLEKPIQEDIDIEIINKDIIIREALDKNKL